MSSTSLVFDDRPHTREASSGATAAAASGDTGELRRLLDLARRWAVWCWVRRIAETEMHSMAKSNTHIYGLCSVVRENGLGPIHCWIFCNQIRGICTLLDRFAGLEKVPRTLIILSVTRSSRSDPCSSWFIVVQY